MRNLLFLLFVISFSINSYGQLGYLGKRTGVEFGMASNYPLIANTREFHGYTVDDDILLPKFSLGIHRENKKGNFAHWQLVYCQLPNSRINAWMVKGDGPTKLNVIDTAWTKSDNLQISLGWRKFRELAPLGLYFELQFKSNIVFNSTTYRNENRTEYTDFNYYSSSVSYKEYSKVSAVPEIGLSLGANFPINEGLLLDVGTKLNLVVGRFRDKKGDPDEIPEIDLMHRILSSRKLRTSNLFEVYVNIILFP